MVAASPSTAATPVAGLAHCLPSFPACGPAADLEAYTYRNLLGPLDASPTVWAECVFVDPRADIAVLGQPDNQELSERVDAYDRLMEDMAAVPVAAAPAQSRHGAGYVLTLDRKWKQGRLERRGHTLGFAPERYDAASITVAPPAYPAPAVGCTQPARPDGTFP